MADSLAAIIDKISQGKSDWLFNEEWRATVPATGTWTFAILLEWSEVVSTAGFN